MKNNKKIINLTVMKNIVPVALHYSYRKLDKLR